MTNLLKKRNPQFLALWLFLIHSAITQAADLTSAMPVVEVNQPLPVAVADSNEEVE